MDDFQIGIIRLIRAALTGEPQTLPADFNLEETAHIGRRHGILTLLYYGLWYCGVDKFNPVVETLFRHTCQSIVFSEHQASEISNIFAAFDENQIQYMPLKGTLLKKLYPKPEMRAMGDADILIKTEQYDIIKPVMETLGFTETLETDHELVWHKSSTHIELHKRLLSTSNKDFYAYFGDGWQLAKHRVGTRYSMTDEDQIIYLFAHFAKHYRNAGIGIRHFVDLWVYHKSKPSMDMKYVQQELTKLSLYDFYVNIMETLAVWFEEQNPTDITEFITATIFHSGAFGSHEASLLSNVLKEGNSKSVVKDVRVRSFWTVVFLPYKQMCVKFPVLEKFPILLPAAWIYRIIITALFRRKNVKKQWRWISLVNKKNVASYQDALKYVGLDFNF